MHGWGLFIKAIPMSKKQVMTTGRACVLYLPPWGIPNAEPIGSSNDLPLATATAVATIFSLPFASHGRTIICVKISLLYRSARLPLQNKEIDILKPSMSFFVHKSTLVHYASGFFAFSFLGVISAIVPMPSPNPAAALMAIAP